MRSLDVFSHPHPHPHPLLECCPPRCGSLSRWWHGDHTRGILSDVALFLLVLRKRSDSESTHLTQVNQTCRVFWVSVDLSPTYDRYIYRRTGEQRWNKVKLSDSSINRSTIDFFKAGKRYKRRSILTRTWNQENIFPWEFFTPTSSTP